MIDVLTNVDNDNFNLDRSKNLLAEYFTGFAKQKYDKTYTDSYEEAFPAEQTDDQQDIMAGVNGNMFNPATGEDEWVGRSREKGKLTEYGAYDYDANHKLLQANKPFPDMFKNIYEPAVVDERSGRVIKWKVKKAGSGMYVMDDDGKKEKLYSKKIAIKNAFGGTYI